jgi:hypothetical protein
MEIFIDVLKSNLFNFYAHVFVFFRRSIIFVGKLKEKPMSSYRDSVLYDQFLDFFNVVLKKNIFIDAADHMRR